ncbi:MBL fold metallo-hydrolase [Candidatus Bathyarchaeota archaeon]|nr:MBL fold metallo-hydrolase [Candidatus Bathyarchaeota archaeon]
MRPGWFCSVLVFFGEKSIGIVDTGYENTPEDLVLPLIRERGREPGEVDPVVNNHRDGDHVGGNAALKEKTGARIAIHSLEAEAVPSADLTFEDGDTLRLGDRDFKVIHTPGHRPGAICLLDESHGLLVTGDSVCGERENLIRMDKAIYIESLRRLRGVEADTMMMSYPFMPASKDILNGSEIDEMIEASIRVAESL